MPATTLERLAGDYIEDRTAAGLSARTIENDIRPRLERIFLAWCAENGISEPGQLDQRAVNRFSNRLLKDGGPKGPLSVHSVAAYVKTVNAFLNWLRRQRLGAEVTGRAHKPKLPDRHVEILTDAEVRAMIRLAGPRDALIVQLLAESGIRVGELVALRRRNGAGRAS